MVESLGQEGKVMEGLLDGIRSPDVEQTWKAMKMPTKTSCAKIWRENPIDIEGGISALEE